MSGVAIDASNGTPIWFWRHDLPVEPLPEGLAVGNRGQVLITTLDGQVLSIAPKQPARKQPTRQQPARKPAV